MPIAIDPLAGSYQIEALTDEIETQAVVYIEKIDEMGGALAAIEHGYLQNEIQDAAYQFQKQVESGDQIVVGVNAYQVKEEIDLDRLEVDPSIEIEAKARLEALRTRRDAAKISELLTRLEAAANSTENLMPLLVECVEHDITLGEICNTLRAEWGEYQPSS